MKPTAELLLELEDIPAAEVVLMCLFVSFEKLTAIQEFARCIPEPQCNFTRALANAPEDANELLLETSVQELIEHGYPELYQILEDRYGNDNDLP
jgi:hypothetical protein